MQSSREVAVGLFRDPQQVQNAVNSLKNAGFSADDISLLVPWTEAAEPSAGEQGQQANPRSTKGLVAGAILGGVGGWLAGIRALTIPIVVPFIAAGSAALGAGIGTVAGGILGMRNSRDPSFPASGPRRERTIVLVQAGSRVDEADRILRDHGADFVEHARATSPSLANLA